MSNPVLYAVICGFGRRRFARLYDVMTRRGLGLRGVCLGNLCWRFSLDFRRLESRNVGRMHCRRVDELILILVSLRGG